MRRRGGRRGEEWVSRVGFTPTARGRGSASPCKEQRSPPRGPWPRGEACKPACKPGSVPAARRRGTAIHLGRRLPGASSGPTRDMGRATPGRRTARPCSALLRAGFTWPAGHPTAGGLLPHHFTVAAAEAVDVSFLWHSPSGRPDWVLPSALLCGARTFLGRRRSPAAVRPTCQAILPAAEHPTEPHNRALGLAAVRRAYGASPRTGPDAHPFALTR